MAMSDYEKGQLRLGCCKIVMECGSNSDRQDVTIKAGAIYKFVSGETEKKSPKETIAETGTTP